jgi:tripeptide aminopeptidase
MFNVEYLKEILGVQSYSHQDAVMINFLVKELRSIEGLDLSQDAYGNLYAIKGKGIGPDKLYPAVVAHVDTVHKLIPADYFHVVEVAGTVFGWDSSKNQMHGIGGDDKVGIYMCLQLLRELDNLKVALFRNEEVGCLGSTEAHMPFFDNVTLVLQADRRGSTDFISYSNGTDLMDKTFLNAIDVTLEKFGYSEDMGTLTDVGQLKKNKLKVVCANVSCGYYNAHSDDEYVVLSEVDTCLQLFAEIIGLYGDRKWLHEYDPTSGYSSGGYAGSGGWGSGKGYNSWSTFGPNKEWDQKLKMWVDLPKKKDQSGTISGEVDEWELEANQIELDNAKAMVEQGFAVSGVCPQCGSHTNFYDDWDSTTDVTCQHCQQEVKLENIDIEENYNAIVYGYENMTPFTDEPGQFFCACDRKDMDADFWCNNCAYCEDAIVLETPIDVTVN